MPMMLRWGVKACPFSASREEELKTAEWKELNSSTQSGLEFIFQNLELLQSRAKEALLSGDIIFVCVGPVKKMLEFQPELNCALTKLEKVVQVLYVGEGVENPGYKTASFQEEEKEYEILRKEMCSVTSLCLWDVYRFWERVKCLWEELGRQGVDKRTVQVRSMVLAFISACKWRVKPWMQRGIGAEVDEQGKGISIIAVDGNGDMINGRVEEMVQLLCRRDDDEEEYNKLMGEIEGEGLCNALRRRWRDGTIRPKSHPHHPLFRLHHHLCFKEGSIPEVRCDACSCVIDRDLVSHYIRYRCGVCEKHEMCQKCFES